MPNTVYRSFAFSVMGRAVAPPPAGGGGLLHIREAACPPITFRSRRGSTTQSSLTSRLRNYLRDPCTPTHPNNFWTRYRMPA